MCKMNPAVAKAMEQLARLSAGREEGREEGRAEGKLEAILTMLKNGPSISAAAKFSGLSEEEVHRLAENLESRGAGNFFGSRDTTRAAFSRDLLGDGEAWMDMIICRNLTFHTYDEDTASRVAARILESFCGEFVRLKETMAALAEDDSL